MSLPDFNHMQEDAIEFALDRYGSLWLMPPGVGKTRGWLKLIEETKGRTLVIAPKLVCMNTWPRERIKWGYEDKFDMRFLHGKNKHLRDLPDISLINYEGLSWLAEGLRAERKFPFKQVIFDEISKMKNPESRRFKDFDKILSRFKYRNGGTGTPVGAHLIDLYGEMYMCDKGAALGTDFKRFTRRYFDECEYTQKLEPYHDAKDEILRLIRPNAISFDINDLDMPDLSHHPVYLKLPDSVRQYYEDMHEYSVVEELDLSAVNAAVRSGKLRQMASGGVIDSEKERRYLHNTKAEHLKEIIDEYQGEPIMVFFEFISDYETMCATLGYEIPALYGKTKERDFNKIVEKWNRGTIPVLALHPRCLHPQTLVLTEHRGWIPIIEVQDDERVFDGVEFVSHDGCRLSGTRPVIDKFGITMTPDHLILVNGKWIQAQHVPDNEDFRKRAAYHPNRQVNETGTCALYELWNGNHDAALKSVQKRGRGSDSVSKIKIPQEPQDAIKVYDLINCGPRNRFVVRNADGEMFVVHNSAGYGLNLQDSGRVIVFYTLPWSFELVSQGIGRLWRQGQKNKVLCYYLLIEDTVDVDVFNRVQARESLHNDVMQALL